MNFSKPVVVAALVAVLFFLASSASADMSTADKRTTVLEHFQGGTQTIRQRDALMDRTGTRFDCLPVIGNHNNKVCQLVQVMGGPSEAGRWTPTAGTLPFPSNGQEMALTDRAILFQEDAALADIDCFYFLLDGDEDKDVEDVLSVCTDIVQDGSVASVQLKGLEAGTWTWWTENNKGEMSSPQTFKIYVPEKISKPTSLRTIQRNSGEVIQKNSGVVPNAAVGEAEWTFGGQIQGASGRLYYSSNDTDYACTGTAIKDHKSGRSLIVTAGHCVWDDIVENFGSNVLFIPNRDAIETNLTGDDIYRMCEEDICGCWTVSAGFVHDQWMLQPWPQRLAYDWGIYVVDDVGAHEGPSCGSQALDQAVEGMDFEVGADLEDLMVTDLGYTLVHNPDLRYCQDNVEFEQPIEDTDTYWLPGCELTIGASGGPWVMDVGTGTGKLVSVNSWSYVDEPGNGGPIIDAPGGRCLVNAARNADFEEIGNRPEGEEGEFVSCYNRDCVTAEDLGASSRRLQDIHRKLCENAEN